MIEPGRRIHAPETWDAARMAYLEGESASSVCDRFGVGLSAFRARARREGWRRTDMPDPELDDLLDDESPAPSHEQMTDTAWRMAARAMRRGRSGETQRWLAVHARLVQQARADQAAEHRGAAERVRAIGEVARQIRREMNAPDPAPASQDVHSVHRVRHAHPNTGPSGPDVPPPDRPLTRAERRRLEKLGRKR